MKTDNDTIERLLEEVSTLKDGSMRGPIFDMIDALKHERNIFKAALEQIQAGNPTCEDAEASLQYACNVADAALNAHAQMQQDEEPAPPSPSM